MFLMEIFLPLVIMQVQTVSIPSMILMAPTLTASTFLRARRIRARALPLIFFKKTRRKERKSCNHIK